jgi:hypothetical protein
MDKTIPLVAASVAALLALSACNNKPAEPNDDPQAEALKNAPPVEAPPMIQANRTYRCKDNSLLYADFYTNNTALVRKEKGGEATTLTAANGQPPYTAEGYSLSGSGDQITYTSPGKGSQSCHV